MCTLARLYTLLVTFNSSFSQDLEIVPITELRFTFTTASIQQALSFTFTATCAFCQVNDPT